MKRITISVPDALALVLADEARRRRRSVSEIAREALTDHLGVADGEPRRIPFAGIGRSKEGDLSQNIDERLREILNAKYERIQRQLREDLGR